MAVTRLGQRNSPAHRQLPRDAHRRAHSRVDGEGRELAAELVKGLGCLGENNYDSTEKCVYFLSYLPIYHLSCDF